LARRNTRDGIYHSRHSWWECKIFARGVNFSRNNAVCYINGISSFITKKMPKLLIFDAFTLLIPEKTVANYALLRCKTFSLKIWVCKIFDKFHGCSILGQPEESRTPFRQNIPSQELRAVPSDMIQELLLNKIQLLQRDKSTCTAR